jgi:hypothetical protein
MLFDVKCIQNPGLNLPQRNVRAHRQRGKPRDRDLLPNTNKQRYMFSGEKVSTCQRHMRLQVASFSQVVFCYRFRVFSSRMLFTHIVSSLMECQFKLDVPDTQSCLP